MINTRVLELLKTPELVNQEDVALLEKEIQLYPYVQSLRAVYLYGTHKFIPENFQKVLSETAAYTTDKKILYQLINKQMVVEPPVPFVEVEIKDEETIKEVTLPESQIETISEELEKIDSPNVLEDIANAEANVNFIEEEVPDKGTPEEEVLIEEEIPLNIEEKKTADLDGTEFTDAVIEEYEEEETVEVLEVEEDSGLSENEAEEEVELKIFEEEIQEEIKEENTESQRNDAELSFHGMDEFLPEVKIEANYNDVLTTPEALPKTTVLSAEEEMKKLIEAVEMKMKQNKKETPRIEETEPEHLKREINFVEGYTEVEVVEKSEEKPEKVMEETTPKMKEEMVVNSSWKPLSIEAPVPDALIGKIKEEHHTPSVINEKVAVKEEQKVEESPRLSQAAEPIKEEDVVKASKETSKTDDVAVEAQFTTKISTVKPSESNVPSFINTWHNWLKIDRVEPSQQVVEEKETLKNKVIDNFIEKEPKISQLKDEVTFVVKEKSDDISHLMTETLARLYVEQKLYSKAIKAFKILIEKYPEKKAYYQDVIKEINEMRPRF